MARYHQNLPAIMLLATVLMVLNACREPVEPDFRPQETAFLTENIWQLESSNAEIIYFQLDSRNNRDIEDTLRIIRRTYTANLDNPALPLLHQTTRNVSDGTPTEVLRDSLFYNTRFSETVINNTILPLGPSSVARCQSAGEWSWSWLRSTMTTMRIIREAGGGGFFLAPEVIGETNYVVSQLNENSLRLGIRDDRITGNSILIRIVEELRFVSVGNGLCVEIAGMAPSSGPIDTRVTLTGNFDQMSRVERVELVRDNSVLEATDLTQNSQSLSFQIPGSATPGEYRVKLRFASRYEWEILPTFTVTAGTGSGGPWTVGPALPAPRSALFDFTIASDLYVGGGFEGYNSYRNVWKISSYDDTWQSVAPLPVPLVYAKGISINGYGYVLGGGYYDDAQERFILSDVLYRYDPLANRWDSIGNTPGGGRMEALAGVQNGRIKFGGGYSQANERRGDWWEYIPQTNAWTQIHGNNSFLTSARKFRSFFVDNQIYFGLGNDELPNGSIFRQGAATTQFALAFRIPDSEIAYDAFVAVRNEGLFTGGGYFGIGEGQFSINRQWYRRDFYSNNPNAPGTRMTDHIHPAGRAVTVVAFNHQIWLIGGDISFDTMTDVVSLYSPHME